MDSEFVDVVDLDQTHQSKRSQPPIIVSDLPFVTHFGFLVANESHRNSPIRSIRRDTLHSGRTSNHTSFGRLLPDTTFLLFPNVRRPMSLHQCASAERDAFDRDRPIHPMSQQSRCSGFCIDPPTILKSLPETIFLSIRLRFARPAALCAGVVVLQSAIALEMSDCCHKQPFDVRQTPFPFRNIVPIRRYRSRHQRSDQGSDGLEIRQAARR